MLTWTGRKFSPLSIIEDSPITFGFLYTPRELVYKYVFEGFLVSNNIWKDNIWSIRVKRRSGEKEYLPPRHFRSWYIFQRLKNIIKERRERLDLDLERHHASALSTAQTLNILLDTICGFSPEYAKSQDSQTANLSTTAPSIHLEMCSCSANNLVRFPKSLLSLELADGSVTSDFLDWLSTCCQEICQSNPTKIFLRELTLSYETCLANDLNVWKCVKRDN
ncbi:unnamed protein product [Clavelina lepadiformis]|uniref:Uncharacterized protein n=1 Tax=Clavelina lepadiformis TaxID=159417 RepID=A0ABP0GYW9_CLALP